jgi:hypothetical protein
MLKSSSVKGGLSQDPGMGGEMNPYRSPSSQTNPPSADPYTKTSYR